jgi:hypothetical protein
MSASPINTQQQRRFVIISLCAVMLFIGAVIALCYTTPLSYFYCLARENSWLAAKTEAELDSRMWTFFTKRSIAPSNSMWGRDHVLKPDKRMVQYLVFAKEPLDVVFDRESRVVVTFTSYE